jgi:hypothetical protein
MNEFTLFLFVALALVLCAWAGFRVGYSEGYDVARHLRPVRRPPEIRPEQPWDRE